MTTGDNMTKKSKKTTGYKMTRKSKKTWQKDNRK